MGRVLTVCVLGEGGGLPQFGGPRTTGPAERLGTWLRFRRLVRLALLLPQQFPALYLVPEPTRDARHEEPVLGSVIFGFVAVSTFYN